MTTKGTVQLSPEAMAERSKLIVDLFVSGKQYREITAEHGYSTATIARAIKAANLPAYLHGRKPPKGHIKQLLCTNKPPKPGQIRSRFVPWCALTNKKQCGGKIRMEADTGYHLCRVHQRILDGIVHPTRKKRRAA